MNHKSELEADVTDHSPPKIEKRGAEDEIEEQVNAKKQKRDEAVEEQKNMEEIKSDYEQKNMEEMKSDYEQKNLEEMKSDYSEHDEKPEAEKSEPAMESLDDCWSQSGRDYEQNKEEIKSDYELKNKEEMKSDYEQKNLEEMKSDYEQKEKEEMKSDYEQKNLEEMKSDYEQKNLEEMKSDYSEHDEKPEAEKSEPAMESLDDCWSESERDFDRSSNEDNPVNDLESSDYNEEEIGEKVSNTPQEKHGTSMTLEEKLAASKTICVRNLSYSVERTDMESLFKDCGEVVDVRFNLDREGRFRGFGHVEFGTAEAAHKALELDNTELLRRHIKVCMALGKDDFAPNRSNLSSSFHQGGRFQSRSEFAKGFDTTLAENKPITPATPDEKIAASKTIYVRNLAYSVEPPDMYKLFKNYGEIVDIRLHRDRDGASKGYGHVDFATSEAALKATELNITEFFNRRIFVGLARERGEYTPSRSWSSSFQKDERFQSQTVPVKWDTSVMEHNLTCPTEVKDTEAFDAASAENEVPQTPATQKEAIAASKTICLRNLSYGVERADIENVFKDCGQILDVRLQVEFATAEAAEKASKLDHTALLNNRPTKVGIAQEKAEYFPNRSSFSDSFQKGERFEPLTVFVAGFNTSLAEEKIKASLEEHFRSCGEITRISLPKYNETGACKGYAHLDFKGFDGYAKALQLDQTELLGRQLSVEKARPKRRDTQAIGGGGSYHFGERDGGDHGGRVGWSDNNGIGGGRGSGGYRFGERDRGDHGGRVGWSDNNGIGGGRGSGGYRFGEREGGDHGGGRVGWGNNPGIGGGRGSGGGSYHFSGRVGQGDNQSIGGRGGGSYHFGGRDGGDHGNRVGWGDSQNMGGRGGGGSYHYGGGDRGDYGGRQPILRSHGARRDYTWTANIPNTDEGTGNNTTSAEDSRRY